MEYLSWTSETGTKHRMSDNSTPPSKRRAVFNTPSRLFRSSQESAQAVTSQNESDNTDDDEPLSSQLSTLSLGTKVEETSIISESESEEETDSSSTTSREEEPFTSTIAPDNSIEEQGADSSSTALHEEGPINSTIAPSSSTTEKSDVDCLLEYFANEKPLGEEELLLYTLLLGTYGEQGLSKSQNIQRYTPIVNALKVVYNFSCSPGSLRNYFLRVRTRKLSNVGRVKRRLRWMYYKKQIDDALQSISTYMPSLFKNDGKDAEPLVIRNIIKNICDGLSFQYLSNEIVDKDLEKVFNREVLPALTRNWSICQHANYTIFYRFGLSIGHAELEVLYHDNSISVVVEGKPKPDEEQSVFTYNDLRVALIEIDRLELCTGVKSEAITQLEDSSILYHTRDKRTGAYVDLIQSRFREKVIRSSFCHSLLPSEVGSICSQCSSAAKYVERRFPINETSTDKRGRFDLLTHDELLNKARQQQSDLKNLRKRYNYLQGKIKDMIHVGSETDAELRNIFNQLNVGIQSSDAKIKNNDCEWEGCCCTYESPEDLFDHLCSHIETQHVAPVDKDYVCKWDGCDKHFKKVNLMKRHFQSHTGSTSDSFFKVLLADQAKALNTPSRQMKWHPLVIKWCLRTYSKSHSLYEDMRQGGFLKLPTGRTLSDYKNFDKPQSGWKMSNITALKNRLIKLNLPQKAAIGGLFFDELKIKEGLVWSQSSWELVGYVDIQESECEGSKDKLATHILQFFYKSLFDNFHYPCAYFLTKGINKETLNRIFWVGVSMLKQVGIDIILACCDGASENRAFINFNRASHNDYSCINPFSDMPLFFLSDPPHLIKKLRNNLFKSGNKEEDSRYTRLMTLDGKAVVWKHVVDVYNRDKIQFLQETPLRRAHMEIDSLSKMRVKLAVEVVARQEVRQNMLRHDPIDTESTQKFLSICEQFWYVFNSEYPLRSAQDHRIDIITEIEDFLQQWVQQLTNTFLSKSARRDHFMSWQTLEDLKLTLAAMKAFIKYIEDDEDFNNNVGRNLYIIPKRISQDFVESFFSKQRQSCGGTQNMTAFTYGYNINSSLSQDASRLVKYKQTNVIEVEECHKAVSDNSTLPKRRSNGIAPNEIIWPLDL